MVGLWAGNQSCQTHGHRLSFAVSTPEPAARFLVSRPWLGRSGRALSPSPPSLSAGPPSSVHLFSPPLLITSSMLLCSLYPCSPCRSKPKDHVLEKAFVNYLQFRSSPRPLCFSSPSAPFPMAWLHCEVVGRWGDSFLYSQLHPHPLIPHPTPTLWGARWRLAKWINSKLCNSSFADPLYLVYLLVRKHWRFSSEVGVLRGSVKKRKWQQGEGDRNNTWLSAGSLTTGLRGTPFLHKRKQEARKPQTTMVCSPVPQEVGLDRHAGCAWRITVPENHAWICPAWFSSWSI